MAKHSTEDARTDALAPVSGELERRHAYLAAAVEHIPAGMLVADAKTGTISLANGRAREIYGVEVDADFAQLWRNVAAFRSDGSRYEREERPFYRALQGADVIGEQMTVVRSDGSAAVLEVSAAPIRDAEGAVIGATVLFQDITEVDARRRAAAEFIANAAHELRTPLAAIVSSIDVLEGGAKHHPAERDRFLKHLSREAERLVRLTRALLVLARVQSGTESPRSEIVELAPLLADVAAALRPAEGVRVHVRCSPQAAALANRGLVEQAVTSIAENAARYTRAGRISFSVAQRNGKVRVRVRDTGRGMPSEELARAGERFYRGDPVSLGGFGLGLSIARQAVEAMGGTLRLESTQASGTTASIELPGARLVRS